MSERFEFTPDTLPQVTRALGAAERRLSEAARMVARIQQDVDHRGWGGAGKVRGDLAKATQALVGTANALGVLQKDVESRIPSAQELMGQKASHTVRMATTRHHSRSYRVIRHTVRSGQAARRHRIARIAYQGYDNPSFRKRYVTVKVKRGTRIPITDTHGNVIGWVRRGDIRIQANNGISRRRLYTWNPHKGEPNYRPQRREPGGYVAARYLVRQKLAPRDFKRFPMSILRKFFTPDEIQHNRSKSFSPARIQQIVRLAAQPDLNKAPKPGTVFQDFTITPIGIPKDFIVQSSSGSERSMRTFGGKKNNQFLDLDWNTPLNPSGGAVLTIINAGEPFHRAVGPEFQRSQPILPDRLVNQVYFRDGNGNDVPFDPATQRLSVTWVYGSVDRNGTPVYGWVPQSVDVFDSTGQAIGKALNNRREPIVEMTPK